MPKPQHKHQPALVHTSHGRHLTLNPAQQGGLGPLCLKVADRLRDVEAPPPVHAEGSAVRHAEVPLSAGPVALDSGEELLDPQAHGPPGKRLTPVLVPGAPHPPDGAQHGDPEPGPHERHGNVETIRIT